MQRVWPARSSQHFQSLSNPSQTVHMAAADVQHKYYWISRPAFYWMPVHSVTLSDPIITSNYNTKLDAVPRVPFMLFSWNILEETYNYQLRSALRLPATETISEDFLQLAGNFL
jgi:hypothetical protein